MNWFELMLWVILFVEIISMERELAVIRRNQGDRPVVFDQWGKRGSKDVD